MRSRARQRLEMADFLQNQYFNLADYEQSSFNGTTDSLVRHGIDVFFTEEEYNRYGLREIARRKSKPYFPALTIRSQILPFQHVRDIVTNDGTYFHFENRRILMDSDVPALMDWAHSACCFFIYEREEDDIRNTIGRNLTPDFVNDDIVAEMKTGVDLRVVRANWNIARAKYTPYLEGRDLSFQGVSMHDCIYSDNTPEWIVNNIRIWGARLCSLVAWTRGHSKHSPHIREIRNNAYDRIQHSGKIYGVDCEIPDLLLTDQDVQNIPALPTGNVEFPPNLVYCFNLKFVQKAHNSKSFSERVEANHNRRKGKLSVMPLFENGVREEPDFSRMRSMQSDILKQCYAGRHALGEYPKEVRADKPVKNIIRSTKEDASPAASISNRERSAAGSTNIKLNTNLSEWLSTRGRAMSDELKKPREDKFYSLDSNFSKLERFIRLDTNRLAEHQLSLASEECIESDNSSGSLDFFKEKSQTAVYQIFRNASEIAEKIGSSFQHAHKSSMFECKVLSNGGLLILNSKTAAKNMFFIVCIPASFNVLFPDEWILDGNYRFSKGHCVRSQQIENFSYLHLKYVLQSKMWRDLGCTTDTHCMAAMMLILDGKEQTQAVIQLSRYAGMQLLSRNGISPTTVLSKFDENPRSLVCAFFIRNLIESWSKMQITAPMIGAKMKGGINYLVDNYISWVDLQPLTNIELITNTWYFSSNTPPVDSDNFQSSAAIMEKLFKAEKNFREEGFAVKGPLEQQDIGKPGTYDLKFFAYSILAYKDRMMKQHGGNFMETLREEFKNRLGAVTFEELATLKKSVVQDRNVYFGDGILKKKMVVENVLPHLEKFDVERPFENLKHVIKDVVSNGNIISVFKKKQKGLREILILTFPMRILQKYIETLSRTIASFSDTEMLSNPQLKEGFMSRHEAIRQSCPAEYSTVYNSADATTWCQGFVPKIFFEILKYFVPEECLFDCANILNLMTSKKLYAPPALEKKYQNFIEEGDDWQGSESLKNLLSSFKDPSYFEGLKLKNCTNMGQGILHFCSSLLHDVALAGIQRFLRTSLKVRMSYQVSSDDSGIALTGPSEIISTVARNLCSAYPLFSAKISPEKSTIGAVAKIYEFNSVWYVQNSQIAIVVKALGPSLTVTNGTFLKRLDAFSTMRLQCAAFGAGSTLVGLLQICQQQVHYKLFGCDEYSDGIKIIEKIKSVRIDALGYFTPDPECIAGLFSSDFSRKLDRRANSMRRRIENVAAKDPIYQRGAEGELELIVHFSQGSSREWLKFRDFYRKFESFVQEDAQAAVLQDPGLILSNTHTRRHSLFKILTKIMSSSLKESFTNDSLYYMQGASIYICMSKCLIAPIVINGQENIVKWNILELIDKILAEVTEEELPLISFSPDENFMSNLVAMSRNSTIQPTARAPIAYRKRAVVDKIKHNTHYSLASAANDIFSGNVTSRTYGSYLYFSEEFEWLRPTLQETSERLMKEPLATIGHILSVRDKKSTVCTLSPTTTKNSGLSDIASDYFKFPSRTSMRVFEEVSTSSLGRQSILGILQRSGIADCPTAKCSDLLKRLYNFHGVTTDEDIYNSLVANFSERKDSKMLFFMCVLFGVQDRALREKNVAGYLLPGEKTEKGWGESLKLFAFEGVYYYLREFGRTLKSISVDHSDLEVAESRVNRVLEAVLKSGTTKIDYGARKVKAEVMDFVSGDLEALISTETRKFGSGVFATVLYRGEKFFSISLSTRGSTQEVTTSLPSNFPAEDFLLGRPTNLPGSVKKKVCSFTENSRSFMTLEQKHGESEVSVEDLDDEFSTMTINLGQTDGLLEKSLIFESIVDVSQEQEEFDQKMIGKFGFSDIDNFLKPRNKTPVLNKSYLGPASKCVRRFYMSCLAAKKQGATTDKEISEMLGVKLIGDFDDFPSLSYDPESDEESDVGRSESSLRIQSSKEGHDSGNRSSNQY